MYITTARHVCGHTCNHTLTGADSVPGGPREKATIELSNQPCPKCQAKSEDVKAGLKPGKWTREFCASEIGKAVWMMGEGTYAARKLIKACGGAWDKDRKQWYVVLTDQMFVDGCLPEGVYYE